MEFIAKFFKKSECTNIEKGAEGFDMFLRLGERQIVKKISLWGGEPINAMVSYRTKDMVGLTLLPTDDPIQHLEFNLSEDLKGLGHGVSD